MAQAYYEGVTMTGSDDNIKKLMDLIQKDQEIGPRRSAQMPSALTLLIQLFKCWCEENSLTFMSADDLMFELSEELDLLHEEDPEEDWVKYRADIKLEQIEWLKAYIVIWGSL